MPGATRGGRRKFAVNSGRSRRMRCLWIEMATKGTMERWSRTCSDGPSSNPCSTVDQLLDLGMTLHLSEPLFPNLLTGIDHSTSHFSLWDD